jgi:Phage integrase, N-terminal SAM-like domain
MPSTGKPNLLDQVRDIIRRKHYSIRTEQAYIDWIKRFIIYHRPAQSFATRGTKRFKASDSVLEYCHCRVEGKRGRIPPRKVLKIIADNLHDAGWSLGWASALDLEGRTIWIVDAHGYGKRFVVRADEKLSAFLELESTIRSAERP